MTDLELERRFEATMKIALSEACAVLREKHGSEARGAAEIGVTRQRLHDWKRAGRVSNKYALKLSEETGVSVHHLRPDVFGPSPSGDCHAA